MLPAVVVGTSLIFQALAAVLALWMIRLTGRTLGWVLLATAFVVMGVRRVIVLSDVVAAGPAADIHLLPEALALTISVLAVLGLLWLMPVFRGMNAVAAALEESREEYRDLFEKAQIGIYRTTPDGRILKANPALVRMLGYDSYEELSSRNLEVGGFGPTYSRETFKEAAQAGEIRGMEAVWIRRDGTEIVVRENATAVRDDRGRVLYYAGTVEDVTERRRFEEQTVRTDKLESLGVLAGGIAHDFNNLLMAVLGNINIARMDLAPGSAPDQCLGEAEKALDRAQALTRQLLTFSKGGSPVLKVMALPPLVQESASFGLSGSRARLQVDFAPDLWPVRVDGGQVAQVVQNLVLNADQAMPEGGTVTIRGSNVHVAPADPSGLAPGPYVRLEVQDEGGGIAPEKMERIFDPYFTTKVRGSGLGLAVCHGVVRRHGGAISVRSAPGEGTTFEILLPAAPEALTQGPRPAPESRPRGQGRILVLDDDDMVRTVVVRMLRELGYDAAGVPDGAAALEAWEEARREGRPFAAAIVDLTVPGGMGGPQAARALRARDPSARLLVASGYSDDPILSDPGAHGFDGVVAKPFRADDLDRALAGVLARRSAAVPI